MLNRRFYSAWILGAILMYAAFYCWHGLVLTDFSRISFPRPLFLTFASITYLLISFINYKLFDLKFWNKFSKNLFVRALLIGVLVGFLLFVVTSVLGISFSASFSLAHFATDCLWQMIEQTLGTLVVAFCYIHIFVPELEEGDVHH